jgi:hypothetical protein
MTDEVGQSLAGWQEGDREALIRQFGDRPVWGVVSTFAADSFYAGMTHVQAAELARREVDGDHGREAVVVLLLNCLVGPPL